MATALTTMMTILKMKDLKTLPVTEEAGKGRRATIKRRKKANTRVAEEVVEADRMKRRRKAVMTRMKMRILTKRVMGMGSGGSKMAKTMAGQKVTGKEVKEEMVKERVEEVLGNFYCFFFNLLK